MSADIALIVAGALAGSFAVGFGGFAFALFALGFWLHVLPPKEAAILSVTCALAVQLATVPAVLKGGVPFRRLAPFVIGGVCGVPIGAWILSGAAAGPLRMAIGVVLLVYSAYYLFVRVRPVTVRSIAIDGAAGFGGGVLGGIAGLSGAIPAAWAQLQGWSKIETRSVNQPFNIAMHTTTIVAYLVGGVFEGFDFARYYYAAPALVVGGLAGHALFKRASEAVFRRVLLAILMAAGLSLLLV
jgi:uncharacterized protein